MIMSKKWKSAYDINRKYNSRWEEIYAWVEQAPDGSEAAYCKICHCVISQKLSSLVSHEKTLKHKRKSESVFGQKVLNVTKNSWQNNDNSNRRITDSKIIIVKNESLSGKGRYESFTASSEPENISPSPSEASEEEYNDSQITTPQANSQNSKSPSRKRPFSAITSVEKVIDRTAAENEFDFFCKSLAVQLKKMSLDRALICQEKLQKVMTEERMLQFRNNTVISSAPIKISLPKSFFRVGQSLPTSIASTSNLQVE